MTSVVIAAHNEAAVIGRCLDALLADAAPHELDVIVVANGCHDETAAVARSRGVRVLDLPEPGKAAALNAGDEAARSFPRVYLDADVMVTTAALRALTGSLSQTVLAAAPRRELVLTDRPWPVRAYFAMNSRLPAFENALFGRGVVTLSEEGRRRFTQFPLLVADDLFLDSLFSAEEKAQVDSFASVVETPTRTRDLVRRLVRVRRGNAQMRRAAACGSVTATVRSAARSSWLTDVLRHDARQAPAAAAYVVITLLAAALASRPGAEGAVWGRDESSRGRPGPRLPDRVGDSPRQSPDLRAS